MQSAETGEGEGVVGDAGGESVRAETGRKRRGRWGAPRVGYRVNAVILWVGTRMLWVGYGLVWIIALGWLVVVPRARRASGAYLERVMGRRGVLGRTWGTYVHMGTVGMLMLDRALMLARPGHGFHVECEGLEHLAEAWRAKGEDGRAAGVLMLTAHFGMAEIAAPYLRRMGYDRPMNIVMYQDATDGTERFHSRHRRMLEGMNVISTTDPLGAGVKIIAALRRGDIVAMRADRTLAGKGVVVTLLGGRVILPAGPFVAGVVSGALVVTVDAVRVGYRRYRCMVGALEVEACGGRGEQVAAVGQGFAEHLEGVLRRYPYQWSNFYDLWGVQAVNEHK